jgi:hypothetical protein
MILKSIHDNSNARLNLWGMSLLNDNYNLALC